MGEDMREILTQLNAVPGVVGSFVCGGGGELMVHAFPPLFDESIVRQASAAVADRNSGVRAAAGSFDLLDFRYNDGRIVVKPLSEAFLLLLCTKAINLQVLNISLNVAKGKLDALIAAAGQVFAGPAPVQASAAKAVDGVLTLPACHIADSTVGSSFEQLGMGALTQTTAQQISNFYKTGAVKKLKLTSTVSGISAIFPFMVVNENDAAYDGKIILCRAIEKKLKVGPGDLLTVEIP